MVFPKEYVETILMSFSRIICFHESYLLLMVIHEKTDGVGHVVADVRVAVAREIEPLGVAEPLGSYRVRSPLHPLMLGQLAALAEPRCEGAKTRKSAL